MLTIIIWLVISLAIEAYVCQLEEDRITQIEREQRRLKREQWKKQSKD
jgi:hypothetical protein